jgi:hypothetical protein
VEEEDIVAEVTVEEEEVSEVAATAVVARTVKWATTNGTIHLSSKFIDSEELFNRKRW